MKTHRLKVIPTPATVAARHQELAREELRRFSQFVDRQDPELLAASVTQVDATLESCARIEAFFRRYVAALADRRVN